MAFSSQLAWLDESELIPSPLLIETDQASEVLPDMVRRAFQKNKTIDEQHAVYKKLQAQAHPDWIQINGDDKMDKLRSVLFELRHKPFLEKFRVFSISDVDSADRHFQNALLKTVEEPEAHWIILLSCQSLSSVLPTIKSRCLKLRLVNNERDQDLDEDLKDAFQAIRDQNELSVFQFVEKNFSKRQKMESQLLELLEHASFQKWPGHWRNLAPFVDEVFLQLDRNLNPKIVWQNLWERSLDAKKRLFI